MRRGKILGIPIALVLIVVAFFLFRDKIPGLIEKVKDLFRKKDSNIAEQGLNLQNGSVQNIK